MDRPERLLVVDKPVGPTSHDVVDRLRRALGEKRIGHTGTLDPAASGVLVLLVGRATRLARFMAADEKEYQARIQLGVETDSYDARGTIVGPPFTGVWPTEATVREAVESLVGTLPQVPPIYSAKKIGGRPSYELARKRSVLVSDENERRPAPVEVTLSAAVVTACGDGIIDLQLTCSAGFYVRSLAHDLGERLATGAHLAALRRTRSGSATLLDAHPLAELETNRNAVTAIVPMARMLPHLPSLVLTQAGVRKVGHGQLLGAEDFEASGTEPPAGDVLRLLTPAGALVAVARSTEHESGLRVLHPSVVLM